MTTEQALIIHSMCEASMTGSLSFPEIVVRLAEIGVERYHADYSRQEKTFYFANGDSLVVSIPYGPFPTSDLFSSDLMKAAVGQSQRGEHAYLDFIRKTMAAGCVGYFVQITGRQAQYFGRRGEMHTELFPPAR